MNSIKKIAGDLLIYFYVRQRKRGFSDMSIIEFGSADELGVVADSSSLSKEIVKITNNSATDAYNALRYLEEKGFVAFKEDKTNISDLFHNIRVTALGVDIIEGVERGEEERNDFHVTFNIKLAENINIESLIKNELGSLIKTSLI